MNITEKQLANLKPIQKGQLSSEEVKKRQINGGKKSVEVRRERKKFKELLETALNTTNETTGECYDVELVKSLINKALSGDVKAFEVIRDTVGEKPIEELNVSSPVYAPVLNKKEKEEFNNFIINSIKSNREENQNK